MLPDRRHLLLAHYNSLFIIFNTLVLLSIACLFCLFFSMYVSRFLLYFWSSAYLPSPQKVTTPLFFFSVSFPLLFMSCALVRQLLPLGDLLIAMKPAYQGFSMSMWPGWAIKGTPWRRQGAKIAYLINYTP